MKYRVLITDSLAEEGLSILRGVPQLELDYRPGLKGKDLEEAVSKAHGLIVRSGTTVTAELLEKAGPLKVIGRAGAGVDNIDTKAATAKGIIVLNTPGGNATTTAEHTIAMMLSMARHIPQANASLRSGKWERGKFTGTELTGKTLGVIGFGNIGKIVARKARGLEMRVLISDPFLTPEVVAKEGYEMLSLDEVIQRSDFLTVHVPLLDSTRHLIDAKRIATTKKGVRILNCARGGVVEEAALLAALESGHVSGAALDVFEDEPPAADHPLVKHSKVVGTPHLGAATEEAQLNVAIQVAEQVRDYLVSGEVRYAVNFPSISGEMAKILQPFLTLSKALGSFHGQIAYAQRAKVKQIKVRYCGNVCQYETKVLTATIVKEFLQPFLSGHVNDLNAVSLAESRGIQVEASHAQQVQDFANQIAVTVISENGDEQLLAGAVFGKDAVRFVRFNDFQLEVVPRGFLLVIHNNDRPGVVGKLGTILGEHKVNISRMQVALDREGGEQAVGFINVSQNPGAEVLGKIAALENIIRIYQVDLGN